MSTDVRLSRTQIDLIAAVIKRHGRKVEDVFAVEISEATTVVEYYDWQHPRHQRHRSELPNMRGF